MTKTSEPHWNETLREQRNEIKQIATKYRQKSTTIKKTQHTVWELDEEAHDVTVNVEETRGLIMVTVKAGFIDEETAARNLHLLAEWDGPVVRPSTNNDETDAGFVLTAKRSIKL